MIAFTVETLHRYGQLSGMVEPVAGLFGAAAVVVCPNKLCVRQKLPKCVMHNNIYYVQHGRVP